MSGNMTTHSNGMVQNLKTGAFKIALTKKDRELMAKKNIVAMCADFSGHFCIFRGVKRKITEQKERYATPQLAIEAVK